MTDEPKDTASISNRVEQLAKDVGVTDGELRFTLKDGRYQRARVVLALTALPRSD